MTLSQDSRALVASGAWFRSLPGDLQAVLLASAAPRRLAAGQRLFARGDTPDGMYCVIAGAVRITGLSESGREALLAILGPAQWLGEIALFDDEPRTHDAWAESDATLLHVPQSALRRLLAAHPAHWHHFGRLLTQKLRAVFAGLEEVASLPPTDRVAGRLAGMATGHGAWSDHSARVLSVSQAQLALMLGLSRQTVNRSLKALEADGVVRCSRGGVEILDLAQLRQRRG